jgi:deoxyribodipyrimidine photolyase-like uncharacterized protein
MAARENSIFLVLPNQLFGDVAMIVKIAPMRVLLLEEPMYFFEKTRRPYKTNKCKLAHMRASLRYYETYLTQKLPGNIEIQYIEFTELDKGRYPFSAAAIIMYESHDIELNDKLNKKYRNIEIIPDSQMFLMTHQDLLDYKGSKRHAPFYNYVKNRMNVMADVPSMDKFNRNPLPKELIKNLPKPRKYNCSFASEAISYINNHHAFKDHVGVAESVIFYRS